MLKISEKVCTIKKKVLLISYRFDREAKYIKERISKYVFIEELTQATIRIYKQSSEGRKP